MKRDLLKLEQFCATQAVKLFYNVSAEYDEDYRIEKDKTYLIVANHVEWSDPFLISSSFSKEDRRKLFPFRYLAHEKFFAKPFTGLFLRASGCFSTSFRDNNGSTTLETAQPFIDNGDTVCIFPEGTRNKNRRERYSSKLGQGALKLVKDNFDLHILPVKITYSSGRDVSILYKKPFRFDSFPEGDLTSLTRELIDCIYE